MAEGSGDIFVRRAVHGDEAQLYKLIRRAQNSLMGAVVRDALRRGWDVYLKSTALCTGVTAYSLALNRPLHETLLFGALAFSSVWVLLLVYIRLEVDMQARKAIEQDLENVDVSYGPATRGSYMWVVCRGDEDDEEEEEQGSDQQQDGTAAGRTRAAGGAKPTATIVACVALSKESASEAEVKHLAVDEAERGKKIAATLLKHLLKYAKQHGVSRLVARVSSAQRAAQHVLAQAGFKLAGTTKVNSWFSAHKLTLELGRG